MTEALAVKRLTRTKREQLIDKRTDLTVRLAAIDESLQLLDSHPEIEQMLDAFADAMKSDY